MQSGKFDVKENTTNELGLVGNKDRVDLEGLAANGGSTHRHARQKRRRVRSTRVGKGGACMVGFRRDFQAWLISGFRAVLYDGFLEIRTGVHAGGKNAR